MNGFGQPGALTPGAGYVQLLSRQPNVNNGTMYGGLAEVLRNALMGVGMNQNQKANEQTQQTLADALRAGQGSPGNTVTWNQPTRAGSTEPMAPTTTYGAKAPDMNAMINILGGDPQLAPLALDLATREGAQPQLKQVYNPETQLMEWTTASEALGRPSAAPDVAGAPETMGGMQYNQQTGQWEPIPGWLDQQLQLREAGRNQNNVTFSPNMPQVGTIPQGFELREVDGGWMMAPIPGGPADMEVQATEEAEANKETGASADFLILSDEIRRSIEILDNSQGVFGENWAAGTVGSFSKSVPGSDANRLDNLLLTLRSKIGLGYIAQMREQSKSGAALGSVTEGEHKLLQAVQGSLELAQDPEELKYNLTRVNTVTDWLVNGVDDGQGGRRKPNESDLLGAFPDLAPYLLELRSGTLGVTPTTNNAPATNDGWLIERVE